MPNFWRTLTHTYYTIIASPKYVMAHMVGKVVAAEGVQVVIGGVVPWVAPDASFERLLPLFNRKSLAFVPGRT